MLSHWKKEMGYYLNVERSIATENSKFNLKLYVEKIIQPLSF